MTPQFDQFIGTYTQIAVTLFIFSLGLPALLFQIGIPEDATLVIRRNHWIKGRYLAGIAVPYAIICCLLMFAPHETIHQLLSNNWQITIPTVSCVLIVSSFMPLFYVWGVSTRGKVLTRLWQTIRTDLKNGIAPRTSLLEDISLLGTNVLPGTGKQIVLNELYGIAQILIDSKHYTGSELRFLLICMKRVIVGGKYLGDEDNFKSISLAFETFSEKMRNAKLLKGQDHSTINRIAADLATHSLKFLPRATTACFVPTLACSPLGTLKLGIISLQNKEYFIAIHCLRSLENQLSVKIGINTSHVKYCYVAFIAELLSTIDIGTTNNIRKSLEYVISENYWAPSELVVSPAKSFLVDAALFGVAKTLEGNKKKLETMWGKVRNEMRSSE